MADATAERSGMMAWVSAIRMSMANDPGRQILDDQIQSGFLFLEDYLDNILAGPRHECVSNFVVCNLISSYLLYQSID